MTTFLRFIFLFYILTACNADAPNSLGINYPKLKHEQLMDLLKEQDAFTQTYIQEMKLGKQAVYPPQYQSNHEQIMKIVAEELNMEELGMVADYQKANAAKIKLLEKELLSPSASKPN